MEENRPKILVVDDEKINRSILMNLLKDEYTVMVAKDGKQALEKACSENPPDLILLDIVMPGINGYDVCLELKRSPETQNIPVVFITVMDEAEDEKKGLDVGAIDYITKPFTPAIVKARVRNHIDLQQMNQKLSEAHAMLELYNEELKALASLDALTGLNNRYTLDKNLAKELEKAKRYGRPLSILMLDIDSFKHVNDTYGHLTGDLVLKTMAQVLKGHLRRSDILGRWGGEEFLIICPETDYSGIFTFAENLRTRIEDYEIPQVGSITASFGWTSYRPDDTPETLIKRADNALYRAKENGRNQVQPTVNPKQIPIDYSAK